ncbi:MAG: hypothetical protein L6R41_005369 [Letrouitia leprolyta]|nr:MAG: hypothetical protein L6R41_005369 [Letrouitia leprolyta]
MVHLTSLTFIPLILSTTVLAQTGTISGTGSLPPYPTTSVPYPISNSTTPPYPTGTGTGGTVFPTGTGTATLGYGYGAYRRGLEMRGMHYNYREEQKEKRSWWWSCLPSRTSPGEKNPLQATCHLSVHTAPPSPLFTQNADNTHNRNTTSHNHNPNQAYKMQRTKTETPLNPKQSGVAVSGVFSKQRRDASRPR